MSAGPQYTRYHPRWYRRRVSVWWWLQKRSYAGFVLRELTSVFVAFFAVVYLWQLRALAQGPDAYAQFLARLKTPLFLTLDTVAFLFVLFHTITWFNLTPTAIVLRARGKRVPDWIIVGANYAAWLVISGAVAVVLLRG
ncbi:MAG: fumarate reductase subunit C [Gemmatimonadales bacterium]